MKPQAGVQVPSSLRCNSEIMSFNPSIQWSASPLWTCHLAQSGLGRTALAKQASPLLQRLYGLLEATSEHTPPPEHDVDSTPVSPWVPLELNQLPAAWASAYTDSNGRATFEPQNQPILGEIESELENRLTLLKQQWQARSPGIWNWLSRRPAIAECLSNSMVVATTLPLFGGQAWPLQAHPGTVVEAMLFDPIPQLPEVLRIVQSLLQSQFELRWGDEQPLRSFQISSILALAAGEYVELTSLETSTWELAFQSWPAPSRHPHSHHLEMPPGAPPTLDEIDVWLTSQVPDP